MTARTPPGGDCEYKSLEARGKMLPAVNIEKKKESIWESVDSHPLPPLFPSLSDEVGTLILLRMPRDSFPRLRSVCRSWDHFFKSPVLFKLRRESNVAEPCIYVLAQTPKGTPFSVYDPQASRWFSLSSVPTVHQHAALGLDVWEGFSCVAVESELFLMGGTRRSSTSFDSVVCGDVFKYDAKTSRWKIVAFMDPPRSWHTASAIGNRIFVAGGQSNAGFLASAQVYDTSLDSWASLPDMERSRNSCNGISLGGEFWVLSGENEQHIDGPDHASVEIFNPKTNSWRLVKDVCIDADKNQGPMVVADGKLLCVHQGRVREYKGAGHRWDIVGYVSPNQRDLRGFGVVSLDKEVYMIGGLRDSWPNQTYTVQELDTVKVCSVDEKELQRSGETYTELCWRDASPMGLSRGTILATAVVWL